MTSPVLSRNFDKGRGSFHPFTYSIGILGTLGETLEAAPAYPLPEPRTDEMLNQFVTALTFYHEALHLAQYSSCSFGLRTLRSSLIVLHYLEKRDHWQMPIANNLLQKVVNGSADESDRKTLIRLLSFLGAADQLRLEVECTNVDPRRAPGTIAVEFVPSTPYFHIDAFAAEEDRLKNAAELDKAGVLIHRLPIINYTQSNGVSRVVLNAASLMEGYALLFELNSAANALGQNPDLALSEILPTGTEYVAAAEYAIQSGACDYSNFILTVLILVDVALMYDPFVLFNSPTVEKPTAGQVGYQLPGETFLLACDAAKRVRPISKYDAKDLRRYYRDLCRELSFPSPIEMAQKAHEVVTTLVGRLPTDPNTRAWLADAIAIHAAGLEARLLDPELFPIRLASTTGIFEILERFGASVSIYHIDEMEPTGTAGRGRAWCENMDLLALHNLMVQSIAGDHIECPLKQGRPFFCPSAIRPANSLCVFQIGGKSSSECLVDVFKNRYGLECPPPQI